MNVVSRGVRNAFRNVTRSSSIIVILGLSIGLALAMQIARQAVDKKIESVKSLIGNIVNVSPAGARGFDGGGESLTEGMARKAAAVQYARKIDKTLQDRLSTGHTTNLESAVEFGSLGRRFSGGSSSPSVSIGIDSSDGKRMSPPITVVGTNSLSNSSVLVGGGKVSVKSGKGFADNSNGDVAVIGKSLADKNGLKVGSTFTTYGKKITVTGIFDAGNTFSNNTVAMPLVTLQRLSDQAGTLSSIVVQVDSITHVDTVVATLKKSLGSAVDVVSQADSSNSVIAPLENIKNISTFSLIGAVLAGAVITLLTMIMVVRERRREIGVLKAVGASNVSVVIQFISEAVVLTLAGAVVGIALGILASQPITQMLVSSNNSDTSTNFGGPRAGGPVVISQAKATVESLQTTVGIDTLFYGLGVALFIALIGSAIPALLIAKVRPAEVMRAE